MTQITKFQKFLWLVLTMILIQAAVSYAGELTIVADGHSNYSIVLAQDAIPAERFAAEDLASHIKQMSGVELKIISDSGALPQHAILLGNTRYLAELAAEPDWEQLGKEGYLIRTTEDHLIIAGGRPRGTMYGVYDLLQDWGCRWFTIDTSHIPKRSTLNVLDIDAVRRPVFEFRDTMVNRGKVGRGVPGQYVDSDDRDDWYAARNRWNFVIRDYRKKDERHGGCFRIAYGPAHNYRWLVAPETYGAKHPEYYALEDGKRLNYRIRGNEVELCLSNPNVAQVAAANIAGWLRADPDADMCFIGQSDTPSFCKCDNCEAMRKRYGGWDSVRRVPIPGNLPEKYWNEFGGFAGWQLQFVNRVAQILEKEFPNTPIGTFAYWRARKPPRGIKAHRNVVIWYCTFKAGPDGRPRRCYCHPVDSGPVNDDFENMGDELGEWSRIASHVYVYDYWLGTWMGHPVNIPTLRQTMRFYRKLGVEGVALDGIRGLPGGFEWLTMWLWSQLAWNPDFDVDQGIDDFCTAYYGAAAPYIKQYMEMACRPENYGPPVPLFQPGRGRHLTKRFTHDAYKPIKLDKLSVCQMGFRDRWMTPEAINRGYQIFEQAKQAVADAPTFLKHVAYARMALHLTMLENLPGTDPRLKDETEQLVQLAKDLGFRAVGYRSHSPDEFREAMRKKIELGAPLYPPRAPKRTTQKESALGKTPPAEAHYVDGADYRNLVPKLRLVANLPVTGWLFKDDPKKVGLDKGYHTPNYPSGDLAKVKIGEHWDSQGYAGLQEGWYRLRYVCPKLPGGKRVFLRFDAVDESAWLYVDGKLIAWYDTAYPEKTWDKPFLLEVTGSLKSQGEHLLAIRVGNTHGAGGIYKPVSLMVEK